MKQDVVITIPQLVKDHIAKLAAVLDKHATFAINLHDGTTYGNAKLADATPAKRNREFHAKELFNTYWPQVEHMQPGDCIVVDPGPYPLERIRSALSSTCSTRWGHGAATTSISNGTLSILRLS